MKMETKQEVFGTFKKEYYKLKGVRGERRSLTKIIDAVTNVTGMGRKSVIRAFNRMQIKDPLKKEKRGRPRYYTPDVTAALKVITVSGTVLRPNIWLYDA